MVFSEVVSFLLICVIDTTISSSFPLLSKSTFWMYVLIIILNRKFDIWYFTKNYRNNGCKMQRRTKYNKFEYWKVNLSFAIFHDKERGWYINQFILKELIAPRYNCFQFQVVNFMIPKFFSHIIIKWRTMNFGCQGF